MMRFALGLAIAAVALSAGLTLARDRSTPGVPDGSMINPPGSLPRVCMSSGNPYQVGEYACIPACHGQRRLARCDTAGSAASWTYISEACPSAMINAPWPTDWNELPVAADMTPKPLVVNKSAPAPEAKTLTFATFRT